MLNKMSYLKITDPTKRDYLVQQLINTRKEILQDSINEKFGDIKFQQDLTKMYQPVTEKVEPVLSTMKALPTTLTESMKAITFPSVQAIEGMPLASSLALASSESGSAAPLVSSPAQPSSSAAPVELGKIAVEYLKKYTEKNSSADIIFGIYNNEGKFYIGNTEVVFNNDDLTLLDEHGKPINTYTGTPGLWELIVSKEPVI